MKKNAKSALAMTLAIAGAFAAPLRSETAICSITPPQFKVEMSKIFDNIETKFEEGRHAILTNVGVERNAIG